MNPLVLDRLKTSQSNKNNFLFPQNLKIFRTILNFLQSLYRATIEIEGDYVIIDRVLFIINILVKYFEQSFINCSIFKFLQI
jgi:hypothetical protein